MRIFKRRPAVFVLLAVTFGLFLATTLGLRGPAPEPGSDITVTIFTDLPSQPDAPAMGLGGIMLMLAVLCAAFAFMSAALTAFTAFIARAVKRCTSRADLPALLH